MKLSIKKLKTIVFERDGGRRRKREWMGEGGRIEEVKEIKYLGYNLQKNGGAESHIKERLRRSMIAMVKTWSLSERMFKEDFGRRMKIFNALVWHSRGPKLGDGRRKSDWTEWKGSI